MTATDFHFIADALLKILLEMNCEGIVDFGSYYIYIYNNT